MEVIMTQVPAEVFESPNVSRLKQVSLNVSINVSVKEGVSLLISAQAALYISSSLPSHSDHS